MSWKKYFKSAAKSNGTMSPLSRRGGRNGGVNAAAVGHYPNLLKESYMGCPNRIERYQQLETMSQDSTVAASLDIISEFSTQTDDQTHMCFKLNFTDEPTDTETKIIRERLEAWYYMNEFHKRAFRIFRNVLKYGDQIFIRDPETFKLFYVEMDNIIKVIVNESKGKKPEQYIIRNINPNFESLTATEVNANDMYNTVPNGPGFSSSSSGFSSPQNPYSSSSRFVLGKNEAPIDAGNILHVSLTEGLDPNWPFGTSILETIFKVYKQKELLEDSIIIYRVQRAPARRVFKIDVGDMPSHLAGAYIEKLKTEIYQRRLPSFGQNGSKFMDTSYSSMAPNEDFFLPQNSSGKGSSIEQLQEGQNIAEIKDLLYFDNKMMRGLQIPSSYLPTGPEESSAQYNDGRLGTALIQEYRFNQYCERLQRLVCEPLDLEFKAFVKWSGVNVDTSMFKLVFTPPQNFAHYRQVELDASKINTFTQLEATPYLSKRFLLKRYLGLTEIELAENAKLWDEEHSEDAAEQGHDDNSMRNIGMTPGSIGSESDELNALGDAAEMPDMGAEGTSEPAPAVAGGPATPPMPEL